MAAPLGKIGRIWSDYVASSLRLDWALARCGSLPPKMRRQFISQKARALPTLLRGAPARMRFAAVDFELETLSDLGTLQSAILDVQDMIVEPAVLPPAATVVDVGANIGQFSAAVLAAAPDARIVCFEPDPRSHERLVRNLAGRPNVDVRGVAAGASSCRATLHRHDLSVMSSLRPSGPGYRSNPRIDVPVVTLDDALRGGDAIDLLKVDVEGYELECVQGAEEVLRRTRYLLVELGLARDPRGDNLSVLRLVKQARPQARIVRLGRPLGPSKAPFCQDFLVRLQQ